MRIEVWIPTPFLPFGYKKVSNTLTVHLSGRPAQRKSVASLAIGPREISFPIDQKFGHKLLQTRTILCPYAGKLPKFAIKRRGFTCSPSGPGGENTLEKCDVCGYTVEYPGNPTSRHALTGCHSSGKDHPQLTYTYAIRKQAVLEDGVYWKHGAIRMAPDSTDGTGDGTLIFMIKSWRHRRKHIQARQTARKIFPDSDILHDGERYLVLQR